MKRVLIIGATGNVGRAVVAQLSAANVQIRALTRDPCVIGLPAELEVVRGDLTVPATLDRALAGVDTVFLVWCAPAEAVAPALERIAKRVGRVVFLSSPHQTPHPFFQQAGWRLGAAMANPAAALHRIACCGGLHRFGRVTWCDGLTRKQQRHRLTCGILQPWPRGCSVRRVTTWNTTARIMC